MGEDWQWEPFADLFLSCLPFGLAPFIPQVMGLYGNMICRRSLLRF